jgi:hypothetical protein
MTGRNNGLKLEAIAGVTPQELAALGGGHIAYIKPMLSEDINRVFPNAPQLEPGMKLFALLSADGSPIMLTDSRDAAYAGAYEHELATVSLH